MFDIGFIEIIIISLVALVVVGPERLPAVARTLGHLLGRARGYVNGIKTDIHNEMRMDELKNLHTSVNETAQSIEDSVRQEVDQIKTMNDAQGKISSPASTETSAETNTPAPPTEPAFQQSAPNPDEQKHNTFEKENK